LSEYASTAAVLGEDDAHPASIKAEMIMIGMRFMAIAPNLR
jgi:hypothetical protein